MSADDTHPNIPDRALEATANALSQISGMRYDGFWHRLEELEPEDRDYALAEARVAIEAALPYLLTPLEDLAESWHARGERDMEYSKTLPEDVQMEIYLAGCEMVENARHIRVALAKITGRAS